MAKKAKVDEKGSKTLTEKQRLFVQCYVGNATEAATKAGYSKNRCSEIGYQLLQKTSVKDAIRKRQEIEERPNILGRQELQAFWSEVATSSEQDMKDRLKASELLGKSDAMFTDNLRIDATLELKKLSDEELNAKLDALISTV